MLGKLATYALKSRVLFRTHSDRTCFFCSECHLNTSEFRIQSLDLTRKFSSDIAVNKNEDLSSESNDIRKKIIYNSVAHKLRFVDRKRLERLEKKLNKIEDKHNIPLSLKFILEKEDDQDSNNIPSTEEEESPSFNTVNLPFTAKVLKDISIEPVKDKEPAEITSNESDFKDMIVDNPTRYVGNWMNDYEKYTGEEEKDEDELDSWRMDYGTPDRSVPVSNVPCGGCGAHLHCQEPSIPGYLPSEIFKNCSKVDLRELICQRCHFLKEYNTALNISVDPDIYPKMLSRIKNERALVILIADMTDLPCSIWPGIEDIIGPKNPFFLVGNKIDLLPGDRRGWLLHALQYLNSLFSNQAPIWHTALVSAKTGFGIEELINKLYSLWQYRGDVYLVGCTNVGKSTLFNALLQSDYCKVKAVDLVQRATTSPWPGTTLNLLKFPILRPEGWRLALRAERLKKEANIKQMENKLRKQSKKDKKTYPQLVGHVGRTLGPHLKDESEANKFTSGQAVRFGLNPNDPDFAESKWVYDTPGVLHKEQFLDLLTTEEISLVVAKEIIEPRTFVLKEGWSLLVAGIARIDCLKGSRNVKVTLFTNKSLPVTIVGRESVEEVYTRLLGTKLMAVPFGSEERLKVWPGLSLARQVTLVGIDSEESCSDITLSSAGWAAITPWRDDLVKMAVWTPKGSGVFVRSPSLLPNAVALRGKKMDKLPAYERTRPFVL